MKRLLNIILESIKLAFPFPKITIEDIVESWIFKYIVLWVLGLLIITLIILIAYFVLCIMFWKLLIPTHGADEVDMIFFRLLLIAYSFFILMLLSE